MQPRKPIITGSIDKDQLSYETNFNPASVSYVGPRVITNHDVISPDNQAEVESIQ